MNKVATYQYITKDGQVVGHVDRLEAFDRSATKRTKRTIPYFKDGGQAGISNDLPASHYLYGMDAVVDWSRPIYFVEGEKCAYALQTLGFQTVTFLGGCGRMRQIDWSPLEGAQKVIILPDHDKSGREYAYRAYRELQQLDSQPDYKLGRIS